MREDFVAFILTHGRPDRVFTYETLRRGGYTGRIVLVVDDEDRTVEEYQRRFPGEVVVFSKQAVAQRIDEGDNFNDRRAIIYARNACFGIAETLGARFFIELDDDYNSGFYIRFNSALAYGNTPRLARSLDAVFEAMLVFFEATPIKTVALSQGGDHIGGNSDGDQVPRLKRKAMNSFICSVDRAFEFFGRINEDVNTYAARSRCGDLFFTVMQAQVNQLATQSNAGGMTDLYLDQGTYVKSFYSVMYAPSCVKVGTLGDPRSPHFRLHHSIDWDFCAPKILRQAHRKAAKP